MNNDRYSLAGWLAMASAAMVPPAVVLTVLLDLGGGTRAALGPLLLLLSFVGTAFSLYALYRFKHLLNHRFGFHDVDGLIILIMIGSALVIIIATTGRILAHLDPAVAVFALVTLMAVGIPRGRAGHRLRGPPAPA